MKIKLLHPYGNSIAGAVIDASRDIALDLIQRGIATDMGNVDGWSRRIMEPTADKMIHSGEVRSK